MTDSPRIELLRGNRRALLLGSLPMLLLIALGLVPWLLPASGPVSIGMRVFGLLLASMGICVAVALWRHSRVPRIACQGDQILLYVRGAQPVAVPLEAVECFFLGQGPSGLPAKSLAKAETSNVVVRLAERATEWHKHETKPAFANWCDGYITIKGAWCEPITEDKLRLLNSQLAQIKRDTKAKQNTT